MPSRHYDLKKAHDCSYCNKEQIEKSQMCGCFYCGRIFPAPEITTYVSSEEPTAECPYCRTDTVLGDASGYPITPSFLKKMYGRWF